LFDDLYAASSLHADVWVYMTVGPDRSRRGHKTRRSSRTARLKPIVGSSGDPELMRCRTGTT
jgi:hypothetical protein